MNTEKSTESASSQSGNSKSSAGSMILKLLLLLIVLAIGTVGALYAMGGNEMEFVLTQKFKGDKGDIYKVRFKVYELLTDPEAVKKWCEGVKKIEELVEPDGDIKGHKAGSTSRITVESEGTTIEFTDEVLRARLNEETSLKMTSDMVDVYQHFKLDYENDEGLASEYVVLTHTYRAKFKGMYRIMAPLAKSALEQQLKKNLASLKKLAEDELAAEKDPDSAAKKSDEKN